MLFPFITGKNFAFRILVELAAALWLGLIAINKEYRLHNSTMVVSVLIFTFIVGLADLLGVNPYNSFWSNYERMEGYVTILHLTLYFMIVKSILRTKKDWKVFFNIFVIASVLVSVFAFIVPPYTTKSTQLGWEYGERLYSTIGNPPFLASYLLFASFLGIILFFSTQKPVIKYIYILPVILNSGVIYFTASRGAILAAFVGIIIFAVFYIFLELKLTKEKHSKKTALLFFSIFIILSVLFLAFGSTDTAKNDNTLHRFATMFSDASVQTRLTTWKMAWEGIKEKPLLGWGQENFIGVYTVNAIPYRKEQVWIDRAHNIIIEWLINAGIMGLISYLAVFGSAFYILWKAFQKEIISKREMITIVTALIVYFISNLFIFDTINTYLIFFTLLAYIDNIDILKSASHEKVDIKSKKLKIKLACILLPALLFFAITVYFMNYKPIRQSQLFLELSSFSVQEDGSLLHYLDDYKEALSYKTFGDNILRKQINTISHHMINQKIFKMEGALEFIQTTAEELAKGVAYNRHNLQYLSDVINFYNKAAFYEPAFIAKTEDLIRGCMRLNPQYERLYFILADNYVLKKDYENAFLIIKKMAALDLQHDIKQLKLAEAAILASKEDAVSHALEHVTKIRMANNSNIASGKETVFSVAELSQFAQGYMEVKNYHKALHYFKEIITTLSYEDELYSKRDFEFRNPTVTAGLHLEIARIYSSLGDRENAVIEAKKAAELDPVNFAEEAKKIID
jgi:O-antigen ligase